MNFKTHAPARREGTTLQPNIHIPARMLHEVFRMEELSERRRAHSIDHAGFEVEEIRARYVHAARGPVVKHVDEAELRVVVAPDAVLVAQHLLNRGAHMVTAPARQYVNNLARRSSLKVGSTREKGEKGGGKD